MRKKTAVILSLISAIISLFYIILVYFGLIRYGALRVYSTESYAKNYMKLDKADDKAKTILSFVIDEEIPKNLRSFVNSLLDQTVRVDEIVLLTTYSNMKNIPQEIKNVVRVIGYNKKYPKNTNLILSILREEDGNSKIILVEPSKIYGKDFVEEMVEKSNKNSEAIVYASKGHPELGVLVKPEFFNLKQIDQLCSGADINVCGRDLIECNYRETW